MKEIYYLPIKFDEIENEKHQAWLKKEKKIDDITMWIIIPIMILVMLAIFIPIILLVFAMFIGDYSGSIRIISSLTEYNIESLFSVGRIIFFIVCFIIIGLIKIIARLINPYQVFQKKVEIIIDVKNKEVILNIYEKKKLLETEKINLYNLISILNSQNNTIKINQKYYTIGENPPNKLRHNLKNIVTDVSNIESIINGLILSLEAKEKEEEWLRNNSK